MKLQGTLSKKASVWSLLQGSMRYGSGNAALKLRRKPRGQQHRARLLLLPPAAPTGEAHPRLLHQQLQQQVQLLLLQRTPMYRGRRKIKRTRH